MNGATLMPNGLSDLVLHTDERVVVRAKEKEPKTENRHVADHNRSRDCNYCRHRSE